MRLLIIGGTGRTGRELAEQSVAAGHDVSVMGRSAEPSTVVQGATAVQADAMDAAAVHRALESQDAVVVALSIPRKSRSPFSPLTGPANLHSHSITGVLEGMRAQGVRRLLKVSAQGVGSSRPRAGALFRTLVRSSNLRPAFEDHAIADHIVQASALDWTILRPPVLAEGPRTEAGLRAGEDLTTTTFTRVRTADVAAWMLRALDDPGTFHRTLTLAPA